MKKLKNILWVFCYLPLLLLILMSSSYNSDSIKVQDSKIDTINGLILNDTLNINAQIVNEDENFFIRNEGTIIGSFLAALVSLISIWITNKLRTKKDEKDKAFQIDLENQKINRQKMVKENIYCGLIHSIYHELNSHKDQRKKTWESLLLIQELTLEKGKFVLEKPVDLFNTEFIDQCRLKILEFESYNTDLLPIISQYILKVKSVNNYIDFKTILSLIEKLEMPFVDAVNKYFEELKSDFDNISVGIKKLQDLIINEIKKYPQNEITNI